MENLRVILLPFTLSSGQNKGQKVYAETWILPAKGNFPEREMRAMCFYDLSNQCVDRINLTKQEFDALKWVKSDGSEITSVDEGIFDFYGHIENDVVMPTVELVMKSVKSGRYSVESLSEIHEVSSELDK